MPKYASLACPICGRMTSMAGFATVSHMQKHVRAGEAREILVHGYYQYVPTKPREQGK